MQPTPANTSAHPNQQLLVSLYDAFARGDIDTAMAALSDDIEWNVNGPRSIAGTYHGKHEVLDWMPRMAAPYQGTLQVDVESVLADQKYGAVRLKETAQQPEPVAYSGVHIWEFSDGRCSRFESLYDDAYTHFWTGRLEADAAEPN